jgi:hypothetical protein
MTKIVATLGVAAAVVLSATAALAADAPLSPAPVLSTAKDAQGRPLPFGVPKYETPDTPLGTGPSKAIMATETSLPQHVLYYPANLDAAGKLPVISWGNGGCIHAGNRFRGFLTEIASYGFLVISAGTMGHVSLEVGPQENPAVRRPGDPPPPPPAPPPANDPSAPWRAQRSNAEHLRQAIDWALAENARPDSKFYNRLDVSKIAVAGQSCGGFLATQAAVDPRVTTLAMFNSGQMMPAVTTPEGQRARANLDGIHTPALYLLGEKELEILFDAGAQNFAYLNRTPVFYAWQDGLQHIGTYGAPGGGALGRIGVAWFQWQLKGDQTAGRMFRGADCLLCVEPTWHVQKKRID